ncbi:amidohydrolase family protein [Balneolales bacterium ANBcel1]|nr:amidohydrolase family protein [Balneolales bacterium ANBcel1]
MMNILKLFQQRYGISMTMTVMLLAVALTACEQEEVTIPGLYAFTDVTVVPMHTELVLENHTVVVRNDQIATVGPTDQVEIPEGANVIDGSGRYLMPGLAEMHGHIPGPDDPQYAEDMLFLYISNGVTTVRNMSGHEYHLELIERIDNGEIPGPHVTAATPWTSPNNIPGPDEAREAVHEFVEAGFDLIKIGNIRADAYEALVDEAHAAGIPFGGHIPEEVGLLGALEVHQASIDHFDRYVEFMAKEHPDAADRNPGFFGSGVVDLIDEERMHEAIERTIEAGTWNIPTLSLVEHLASPEAPEEMIQWPEMRYMPQSVLDHWVEAKHNFQARDDFQQEAAQRLVQVRRDLLKAMHEHNAPIALGSDAPQFFNVPGFSIHHEMEMMVAAGLTPFDVLVTGTRNPAGYLNTPDAFGTVEEGRRADLILLEANPLVDIAAVRERAGVMIRGEWWPEERIQEQLESIADRYAEAQE